MGDGRVRQGSLFSSHLTWACFPLHRSLLFGLFSGPSLHFCFITIDNYML